VKNWKKAVVMRIFCDRFEAQIGACGYEDVQEEMMVMAARLPNLPKMKKTIFYDQKLSIEQERQWNDPAQLDYRLNHADRSSRCFHVNTF